MTARLAIACLLLLAGCTWVQPASAREVRRCTAADGSTVVTDKPCAAIGGFDRIPPTIALRAPRRDACARTLDALSHEVASAIELQDANRLAAAYHWVGMDGEQAYRVFGRLEAIARRPLLDIAPVGGGADAEPVWREDASGLLVPVYPKPRPPTGLRIVQLLGRGDATTRTSFGLRRHAGCLWLTF